MPVAKGTKEKREKETKFISMFYVRIDYWLHKAMNNLVSQISSRRGKKTTYIRRHRCS